MTSDGKPENLWDLCEGVCIAIKEKPDNYFQGAYSVDAKDIHASRQTGRKEVCGTAFCRAGWMVAQLRPPKLSASDWNNDYISTHAENLLSAAGIPSADIEDLFAGGACSDYRFGTPEYVAEGIAGMRAFMTKHEALLRAAPVVVED